MGVQQRTDSFIRMVVARARELAAVELFDSKPTSVNGKMAVDHVMPVIWQGEVDYELRLVCRVNHQVDGKALFQLMFAGKSFTASQVLAGAREWPGIIEPIVYPMIKNIRNRFRKMNEAAFIRIDGQKGCPPNMRRVLIERKVRFIG